jgi:hypothetical protein
MLKHLSNKSTFGFAGKTLMPTSDCQQGITSGIFTFLEDFLAAREVNQLPPLHLCFV